MGVLRLRQRVEKGWGQARGGEWAGLGEPGDGLRLTLS